MNHKCPGASVTRSPPFFSFVRPNKQAQQRAHVILDVRDDDGLDLRLGQHLLHRAVEAAHAHNRHRAAVRQLVLQFRLGVGGIAGDDHAAGLQNAVERDDELRDVGHEDRHPIALLHAQIRQSRRHPIGQIVELAVGQRALGKALMRRLEMNGDMIGDTWPRCLPETSAVACSGTASASSGTPLS